jgi:hypothetical protein
MYDSLRLKNLQVIKCSKLLLSVYVYICAISLNVLALLCVMNLFVFSSHVPHISYVSQILI